LLKPDDSGLRDYLFDGFPYDQNRSYMVGSPDDDPPWDHFGFETLLNQTPIFVPLPIAENRYEIMAFAAEARSRPLGVLAVAPLESVSLARVNPARIWPPDTEDPQEPYSRHKWHSAQFRSTNMRQQGYWSTLLGQDGFGIR
jgi:hypothetical protein